MCGKGFFVFFFKWKRYIFLKVQKLTGDCFTLEAGHPAYFLLQSWYFFPKKSLWTQANVWLTQGQGKEIAYSFHQAKLSSWRLWGELPIVTAIGNGSNLGYFLLTRHLGPDFQQWCAEDTCCGSSRKANGRCGCSLHWEGLHLSHNCVSICKGSLFCLEKKARKVSARAHTWALPVMESIIMWSDFNHQLLFQYQFVKWKESAKATAFYSF